MKKKIKIGEHTYKVTRIEESENGDKIFYKNNYVPKEFGDFLWTIEYWLEPRQDYYIMKHREKINLWNPIVYICVLISAFVKFFTHLYETILEVIKRDSKWGNYSDGTIKKDSVTFEDN